MSDFLLIHGAGHGAWAWQPVIGELVALGHGASAIDLPGRGRDCSLDDQVQAVLAAAVPGAVLVGHSAGGFAITAAAEAAPDRFSGLIYVCAYVPRPEQSLAAMRRSWPDQPLAPALRVAADWQTYGFDPGLAADLFFHDCPDPATHAAWLCAEALTPAETALPSTARAESLPRGYVICQHDRAIPPAFQQQMARGIPHRAALPSGHAPFLALPCDLAATLVQLAAAF